MTPEFVGQAARTVGDELQDALRPELAALFAGPDVRAITVSYCYTGYTSEPSLEKVILGVEIKQRAGFDTHIVKIGTPGKVARDFDGWEECLRGIEFTSRIFLPVERRDLPNGRVAVIYRDAYTLYGPDRYKTQPESLEQAVNWAVTDDKPTPASVERAVIQIYTDLGRWLYHLSKENAAAASTFYHARLRKSLQHWTPAGTSDPAQDLLASKRLELRRDAIWLFCGNDAPEGEKPATYLDPVDYVSYALKMHAIPPTLVGRAHGDLHGRNIIVGIQRGEVDYPAVFDYGEMGLHNVAVWDFVKLETELKVRLLPVLYRDTACREALLHKSRRTRPTSDAERDVIGDSASRADRLKFAFRFERLLAEGTGQIQGRADAESRQPPGTLGDPGAPALGANGKVSRLLSILLRIRQEAALWLGYELNRQHRWREEYDFGLAVYGLVHARPDWDYEPRQSECALVSAGVAAASLQSAQALQHTLTNREDANSECFPSFRVPLAIAHRWWKAGRIDDARRLVERFVEPRSAQSFAHAVPLLAEHALLLAEQGHHQSARHIVRPLQDGCEVVGDFETLCRIGRAYKESGDEKWEKDPVPFAELHGKAAWQMYGHALGIYRKAFDICGDYYPGINAATLAWLHGEQKESRRLAQFVLDRCEKEAVGGDSVVWVFASEGEACLLLGLDKAAGYYDAALGELDPSHPRIAQSMYDQLCRLWQALGADALDPVLRVFEARPAIWRQLKPGPLGDCGGRCAT